MFIDGVLNSRGDARIPLDVSLTHQEIENNPKGTASALQDIPRNHHNGGVHWQHTPHLPTVLPNGIEIPEVDYDDPKTEVMKSPRKPPVPPPKTRVSNSAQGKNYGDRGDASAYNFHSAQENGRQSNNGLVSSNDSGKAESPRRYFGNVGGAAGIYDKELQQKLEKNYSPALNDGEFGKGADQEDVPRKTHMTMINAKMMAKMVSAEMDLRKKP